MDGSVIIVSGGYKSAWNGGPSDSPFLAVDKLFFALSDSPHCEIRFEPPDNGGDTAQAVSAMSFNPSALSPTPSRPPQMCLSCHL